VRPGDQTKPVPEHGTPENPQMLWFWQAAAYGLENIGRFSPHLHTSLHIAAMDAGFADIPKYRSDRVAEICKPKAQRFGIKE
jgi:hypothetical protein